MSMVKTAAVTGGVDTHADTHVAAALDGIGGLLGVAEFPASPAGYARLLGWLQDFGAVCLAGIEGTGSYGAGLARHVAAAGIRVVEAGRPDRQDRHRQGKSGPLDAVSAARAALSGRASGAPRGRDGQVEAIRALMVAKRTARSQRTQTTSQARSLIITGPDDIRTRFTRQGPAGLVAELAALRPRAGSMVRYHALLALRELGRRAQYPGDQLARLDDLIVPLVTARSPGLLALHGIGPDTAAILLIAAGDHRPAAIRSRLGAPVRLGAHPRDLGQDQEPAPALPRRRPAGQPRALADRHHPDELAPAHPRLCRPAEQGRPDQARDHPLPQTLRSPRNLPLPATGLIRASGGGLTLESAAAPLVLAF
ncbi:MAG TPA: transposase [Streptosporangiaceae bacterium]|nr:transposase [Streptosporangiaceae bacterium]